MSKIFLTGHTGFIGKHLYPKLINLGHDVTTDIRFLHSKKYDLVIHLAAVTHIRCQFDPELIESNVLLTSEVFKTPSRVIYASSCSAAHLTNPYAYTKKWAEYCGMRHGNSLGLRFHNVYGLGNNKGIVWWLLQQPDGAKIKVRGPELIRDYIYIDDVVQAILSVIEPSPTFIDIDAVREANEKSGLTMDELIRLAFQNRIFIGEKEYVKGRPSAHVVDVGTGLATETMGLVNIYQRLSGKTFDISVEEAGSNEPKEMVAKLAIPNCIDLHEGLKKIIEHENINSGS